MLDLGAHLHRLGLQPLLDLDPGRARHPGDVPELLEGEEEGAADAVDHQRAPAVPAEVEGGGEPRRAAADDQGVVEGIGHEPGLRRYSAGIGFPSRSLSQSTDITHQRPPSWKSWMLLTPCRKGGSSGARRAS